MSMVTKSYFRYMCFENTLLIGKDTNLNEVLSGYVGKTYIPICKFALENRKEDELQSAAQELIERQSGADSKIRTPLSYFLSELICNIREHSKSPYGYIHAQYLRKEQCIDVSIADDGITVLAVIREVESILMKLTVMRQRPLNWQMTVILQKICLKPKTGAMAYRPLRKCL